MSSGEQKERSAERMEVEEAANAGEATPTEAAASAPEAKDAAQAEESASTAGAIHCVDERGGTDTSEGVSRYTGMDPKIVKMWEDEEALSLDERRARYRARSYTDVRAIPLWPQYYAREQLEKRMAHVHVNEDLNSRVSLWRGNTLEIDAIQNAANRSLLGGGGIDGAIHNAAGRKLVKETYLLDGCETGNTKISRGYALPAKYVLHTVGPVGEEPELLESCYRTTLDLCVRYGIRTVALCGVSTGIFGYPRNKATRVALRTVRTWLEEGDNASKMDRIVFVVYLDAERSTYERIMPEFFPVESDEAAEEASEESETSTPGGGEREGGDDRQDSEAATE